MVPARGTSTGSVASSRPTTNATRYVLIGIVSPNRTATLPVTLPVPSSKMVRSISGPLEMAIRCGSTINVTSKTALKSGSSKHGNARRQSVACICDVAMTCSLPSASMYVLRYQPCSLSLSVPANVISMVVVPGSGALWMTSRSVPECSSNVASSPPTLTSVTSSSTALSTMLATVSLTVASMMTWPTKLAAARSGCSASV